ncbi:MAG: M23 family metallopeptidase [Deltaproteobacteria bacterium]|nr:M23 family metallopeptidase [Deltaproteobacteria bacterium]
MNIPLRNEVRLAGIVALSLCLLGPGKLTAESPFAIFLQSSDLFQGDVVEVRIQGDVSDARGIFLNREIPFFPDERGYFSALVGLDLEERPRPTDFAIQVRNRTGEVKQRSIKLHIRKRDFAKESISVSTAFDSFDEATKKRIDQEKALLNQLWGTFSDRRLWEGRFVSPVAGAVSSPFGLRRIINGIPRAPHGGVDLKASLGTEVAATNHGQVVLRDELFFSGKSIVIDHGSGLYTMYFHLADYLVEKGSVLRKGDRIGAVGMTGRVTGPHLHWGARVAGARVNPLKLLESIGVTE